MSSSSSSSPNRSALDKKKQQAARSSPSKNKVAVGRTYVPQSTELTRSLQTVMQDAGPLVAHTSLTTYIASIHAALLKRHPTWNVPERRTTKFVKRLQSNDTSDLQSVDSSRSSRRRSFSWRNKNKSNNSADDDAASVGYSRGSLRRLFGRNSGSSKSQLAVPPVETVPASKSAQAEPLPSLLSPATPTQTEDNDDLLLPPSIELTKSTSSSAEDNEVVSTEESEPTGAEEPNEQEQELEAANRSLALAEDEEEEKEATSTPSSASNSHFYRTTTVVATVALVAAACSIGLARHGARK